MLSRARGLLYAARLGGAGTDTGVGLEISVLTAAVLGGNSLGGGRGSVAKALIGAIIVLIMTNSVSGSACNSGSGPMVLGLTLLFAVFIDVRWVKNRDKLLSKVYMSPAYVELPQACSPRRRRRARPYALNNKLAASKCIGLGEVEGPEDVILDNDDNLYCGTRHGDIVRFRAARLHKAERSIAHIGGSPLGMAFDRDGDLLVCVGGMGLYRVAASGEVSKVTDETNRSRFSIIDDSRLRLADDLDIAPDGRVFFSEATIRYEMHDWAIDALESRGNGRIICYDPKTGKTRTVLSRPDVSQRHVRRADGQSLLFAESWACRVSRYWFDGPKAGNGRAGDRQPSRLSRQHQSRVRRQLLGRPCSACALRRSIWRCACRTSAAAWRGALAPDEWLYPNINTGCVIKFDEKGEILETLWDTSGENHPMITSMREHKGYLYLGGISNNRIGRIRLPAPIRTGAACASYWGQLMIATLIEWPPTGCSGAAKPRSPFRRWTARCKPNQRLEERRDRARPSRRRTIWPCDGRRVSCPSGADCCLGDGDGAEQIAVDCDVDALADLAGRRQARGRPRRRRARLFAADHGKGRRIVLRGGRPPARRRSPSPTRTHSSSASAPRNNRVARLAARPAASGTQRDRVWSSRLAAARRTQIAGGPRLSLRRCSAAGRDASSCPRAGATGSCCSMPTGAGAGAALAGSARLSGRASAPAATAASGSLCSRRATNSSNSCCAKTHYRRRMMAEVEPEYWVAPALPQRRSLPRADAGRRVEADGHAEALGADALLRAGRRARRGMHAGRQLPQPRRRQRHGVDVRTVECDGRPLCRQPRAATKSSPSRCQD